MPNPHDDPLPVLPKRPKHEKKRKYDKLTPAEKKRAKELVRASVLEHLVRDVQRRAHPIHGQPILTDNHGPLDHDALYGALNTPGTDAWVAWKIATHPVLSTQTEHWVEQEALKADYAEKANELPKGIGHKNPRKLGGKGEVFDLNSDLRHDPVISRSGRMVGGVNGKYVPHGKKPEDMH